MDITTILLLCVSLMFLMCVLFIQQVHRILLVVTLNIHGFMNLDYEIITQYFKINFENLFIIHLTLLENTFVVYALNIGFV